MPRIPFRWSVVALLFAITVVNYIDRSAISYAVSDIESELGLSSAQMGLILGAFGVGYFATTLIGGAATDVFGARIVMAVSVAAWTLAIGMTGLAVGFAMLYVARVVLGLAEGPSFPAMTGAVGAWLPPEERGTALSGALVAVPISLAIGAPLVSSLITVIGWRATFLALAALGLLWLPFWLIFFSDTPARSRFLGAEERRTLADATGHDPGAGNGRTAPARSGKELVRVLLTTPTLLANYWAFFVLGYYLFFFLTWLPSYLHDRFKLEIITVGFLAAIPWLAASAAMVLAGRWSDRVLVRSGSLRRSRSYQIAATQLIAALAVIPVALIDNLVVAMAGLTVAVAATLAANAAYFAVNVDLVPRHVAPALGVMDACFALAGFAAPVITGFVYHHSGSFAGAFILMAVLAASSVIGVLVFHRPDVDRERLREVSP